MKANLVLYRATPRFHGPKHSSFKPSCAASGRLRRAGKNADTGGRHVVGVDIGGTNLRVALADIREKSWASGRRPQKRTLTLPRVVHQICEGVRCLLRQTSARRDSLCAVAAGAPGVTDADAGIVIHLISKGMAECSIPEFAGISSERSSSG